MAAGIEAKAEIVAIIFHDPARAKAARRIVRTLMHTHALCVDDAAVVVHTADGRTRVHARRGFPAAGLAGGVAWGAVLGGLFFQPVTGLIAGAIGGLVIGALTHSGLSHAWLAQAAQSLKRGEAALMLAVSHPQDQDALAMAAGESGRIVRHAHRHMRGTRSSASPAAISQG